MSTAHIRPGMEVISRDGQHVGTVDHIQGGFIKLRRNDPEAGGEHHMLRPDLIMGAEGNTLHLTITAEEAHRVGRGEAGLDGVTGDTTSGRPYGSGEDTPLTGAPGGYRDRIPRT